jgi:hypothetical protein
MTLVHALLQPNWSLQSINNDEEECTNGHSDTENPDRGRKTTMVILNNNATKHVVQASTKAAITKETKCRTYEQHAAKRHKIHISTDGDTFNLAKIKTKIQNGKDAIEQRQVKLHKSNMQNKQQYKKDIPDLKETICVISMIQLNNLIIVLKKKVYLYLISQLLNYNHIMEVYDETIIANWKTTAETYDMISKYFKILSINRKYFITWKLLSLVMSKIPAFKEIIWRLCKNNDEYEDAIETKIKQEGVKIVIYLIHDNLTYDAIGMPGTKVKLNTATIVEYLEILDLIKSYNEQRPLPIESNKFAQSTLNIDKDIWIKGGEIVAKDCSKEVWYVTEDYAILCKECNDEPNNEINEYFQRKDILHHESNANENKDDVDDPK